MPFKRFADGTTQGKPSPNYRFGNKKKDDLLSQAMEAAEGMPTGRGPFKGRAGRQISQDRQIRKQRMIFKALTALKDTQMREAGQTGRTGMRERGATGRKQMGEAGQTSRMKSRFDQRTKEQMDRFGQRDREQAAKFGQRDRELASEQAFTTGRDESLAGYRTGLESQQQAGRIERDEAASRLPQRSYDAETGTWITAPAIPKSEATGTGGDKVGTQGLTDEQRQEGYDSYADLMKEESQKTLAAQVNPVVVETPYESPWDERERILKEKKAARLARRKDDSRLFDPDFY